MARERDATGKLMAHATGRPEPSLQLANATLPACLVDTAQPLPAAGDGLVRADIEIADDRIQRIAPPARQPAPDALDLDGGMAWPCFVDMHTHLDKGHIWPRKANPDGTFRGALEAAECDRTANWSADDIAARMDFSLRCAHAHGTKLVRTHLDSHAPQHRVSWPVFERMRAEWAGRIDLQAVSLFPLEFARDPAYLDEIANLVARHDGVLGCVTYMTDDLDRLLDAVFRSAAERGLDLDFHSDESQDPSQRSLAHVAEASIRHRFEHRVTCGHCCSLATQDADEAARTIDRVAEAGIAVVSLPLCNLYLQDRQTGRTPRARGITLLHELAAAGVAVAVASDNTRDPFYAYGDLDMVEVFRAAVRIGHLDHPFADWPAIVSRTPGAVLRRPDCGVLREDGAADLVLFRARNWSELLARPQADRTVIRAGRPIEQSLPDHRELDDPLNRKGAPEGAA
jgi:cytosine/creatinine deaminase